MADMDETGDIPHWLFDRQRSEHPWADALEDLRKPGPGRRWAVAANWRMDHRVSEEREADDLQVFGPVRTGEDWWETRGRYFRGNICRGDGRPTSSYAMALNRSNRIPTRVASFDRLVHVASLNALLRRISSSEFAADFDLELRSLTGRGLPVRPAGSLHPGWFDAGVDDLASLLRALDVGTQRAARLMLDALGEGEPPWWGCFAEEIPGPLRSGSAARICSALGLGHRRPGEWLLVWIYPISEAGPLYRPTVLEANDSPFHHPSPPEYPFGITMPLEPELPACREVLHRPLRGEAAERWCTGEVLQLESFPGVEDNEALRAVRGRHRERLRHEFPEDGCLAWLKRHPEP